MAKTSTQYVCSECGWNGPKWYGRCPECGQWGTVEEFRESRPAAGTRTAAPGRTSRTTALHVGDGTATPITEVGTESVHRLPTGFGEFDRVLGGGNRARIGHARRGRARHRQIHLLLQTAGTVAKRHPERTVLYLSGEESQAQVRMRAARIDAVTPNLLLASTTDLATVLGLIERERPALAIVDSAQTIVSQEVDGISGGSTQVREVASALIDTAKSLDVPVLLVGHVTKDGSIAGPRTLEHLVDVVCQFEGDAQTALRNAACGEEPVRPDRRGGLLRYERRGRGGGGRPLWVVSVRCRHAGGGHLRDVHSWTGIVRCRSRCRRW